MIAGALANELEARLRVLGTPERAAQERAYLKSSLDFLGVTVPAGRVAIKAFLRDHPELDTRAEVLALVDALWTGTVFERRRAAVEVLSLRVGILELRDLAVVERLVRDSHTWALVDGLAGDIGGRLVARHDGPDVTNTLDRWATDDDFWVRRSALLAHLVELKSGVGFERFARYADAMLEEREFFIRKAIGWVLREEGRRRPEVVTAWLLPRASRASGVTLTEALRWLDPDQVAAIHAAKAAAAQRLVSSAGTDSGNAAAGTPPAAASGVTDPRV
jgi:3-methyladenine DNA glycosylase AlkD